MSKRLRTKSLILLAVSGCAVAVPAREASAALAIAFEHNQGAVTLRNFATDNNVIPPGFTPSPGYVQILDVDPTVGALGLGSFQPFPGYTVAGSVQTQTISPGGVNTLDSSALSVTNNTGGLVTATMAISGTNFAGPTFANSASGAITWQNAVGSTIDGRWFNDPANGQGAESATDRPGSQFHFWLAGADTIADADATSSGEVLINNPASFSMTLGLVLATTDADAVANNAVFARVVNRGMTAVTVVPEPASIALAGLLGTVCCRRRRIGR